MSINKIPVEPIALEPMTDGAGYSGFYALGCLTAYAKIYNGGSLLATYDFAPVKPTKFTEKHRILSGASDDPVIALLSCYVWNSDVNMAFAKALKQCRPNSLIIVGGPQIPKNPIPRQTFFNQHSYIDIAVRDEGEITLAELLSLVQQSFSNSATLSQIDFSSVAGISFRLDGDLISTQNRLRTKDLSIFPSPYTTGEYDPWISGSSVMMLESNRGCPYGCTFCDWGSATLSKVNRLSMERIFAEIDFAAERGINQIHFCDANFGILPRDVEITRYVIEAKNRYGYPKKMSFTNAKSASKHLREVIKISYQAELTELAPVSLQTTDHQVLDNVERANIKTDEYRKLIAFLHEQSIPTNSDMMIGLPGQTLDTCKKDLQFFFDHKVLAVIFQTSVMPNAPMADEAYREKYKIKFNHDGLVESTYSFTRDEYMQILDLCLAYKLFVKHGLLKYFLYFIQIEYQVKAIEFIDRWINESAKKPDLYFISHRIRRELLSCDDSVIGGNDWLMMGWSDQQASFLFDDLQAFQSEILLFLQNEFGLQLTGSAIEAILTANRGVMRKKGRSLPTKVPLDHDVPQYFTDLYNRPDLNDVAKNHKPLDTREPGLLELMPQPGNDTYQFLDTRPGSSSWEVASNLRI